jgi:hypothetical protein
MTRPRKARKATQTIRPIQPSQRKSLNIEGIKINPLINISKRAIALRAMLIQKPLNPVWSLNLEGHIDSKSPTPTNKERVRDPRDLLKMIVRSARFKIS